jgi:GNAT superfamily N-acetyltransferase
MPYRDRFRVDPADDGAAARGAHGVLEPTFRPGKAPLMARRLADLRLDNLQDMPPRCRSCVFWELDPVARRRAEDSGDTALEKEAWLSAVLLDWGQCGKVCYVDGEPAGFAICAPPALVPRSMAFPTSPVSPDAALLLTAHVLPQFAGGGLGKLLVQGLAKQLLGRPGIKAIEAFGDARWERPACLLPVGYLEAVGFATVRPHPRYPRMRLDLRTALRWRAEVESALDRLRGAVMPPETAARPAPTATSLPRVAQR